MVQKLLRRKLGPHRVIHMTGDLSRRKILQLASTSTALPLLGSIPVGAADTGSGAPTPIHRRTLDNDLRIVNHRSSDVNIKCDIGGSDEQKSLNLVPSLESRNGDNEFVIESLSVPAGRYRISVSVDGEAAVREVSLSSVTDRDYERIDVRFLPNRISIDYVEL